MKEKPLKRGNNRKWATFCYCLVITALFLQPACAGKEDRIAEVLAKCSCPHVIYVSKKNFILEVYNRRMVKVASFPIGYGSNPDGGTKLCEGDNRTPEGIYHVNEILSMDAEKKTDSYRKLRDLNRVFFRARDGHSKFGEPDRDLGDNAYGPRYFGLSYPNEEDKKRYRAAVKNGSIRPVRGKLPGIGHGIAIHGNSDENGIGHLSSSGCVRMYNSDIVEVEQYIQLRTPVIIGGD